MSKKFPILFSAAVLLATVFTASAQQPARVPRIGYLSSVDAASESARAEGIRQALRERGYIDGQNIIIDYRYAEGKRDQFAGIIEAAVRLKVDLIVVAGGDLLAKAAKEATRTIPIVMTGTGADPVEAGLVESLARPGGNVTGVTILNKELGGKRLELLKESFPKLANVAVLYDPAIPPNVAEVKDFLAVRHGALALTLRPMEVRNANDFVRAFAALKKPRSDGLYVLQGPLMRANQKSILSFASNNRLPSVYSNREFVDAGGLMYYGADLADTYRRVGYYVERILQGAKPADLPVEQPKKFEFIINLKAAKQIGATIPPNVLVRADRVIR
jgi:putative ABC transport system substrate-binding protein